MRLFAPNSTDIVVDLFTGTISTVIAALLEGLPVDAFEKDPDFFKIGESHAHNLQDRCGAAGLLGGLSPHHIILPRSDIPSKISAPDSLKHDSDKCMTELAYMEDYLVDK
jgi:hypothetical protein